MPANSGMQIATTREFGHLRFNLGVLEWEIPFFSEIHLSYYQRLWSTKFYLQNGTGNTILEENRVSERWACFMLKSTFNDHRPHSVRIGAINVETNTEIGLCIADWMPSVEGFIAPCFITGSAYMTLARENRLYSREGFRFFCESNMLRYGQNLDVAEEIVIDENGERINILPRNEITGSVEDFSCIVEDTQLQKLKNLEKHRQNLKDLYIHGTDCDLMIKVKDREFKAHKVILRACSPILDAMLSHNFTEKSSGVIRIDDVDPEVFNDFLLYVYAGKAETLSSNNVYGLYYAADKYQLSDLKQECTQFLKNMMSVDTVLDVLRLAGMHSDDGLWTFATGFFIRNVEEILPSEKWLSFLKENPTQANELYLKALKIGYVKKMETSQRIKRKRYLATS